MCQRSRSDFRGSTTEICTIHVQVTEDSIVAEIETCKGSRSEVPVVSGIETLVCVCVCVCPRVRV